MTAILDAIHHTAEKLGAQGIQPGMRVGFRLPNQAAFAVTAAACWRIGAVPVPLSTRYTHYQTQTALKDMKCRSVILDKHAMREFSIPVLRLDRICHYNACTFGGVFWDDLNLTMEQEATMVLTSGSMGRPKGILHTFANHYYSALGSHERIPFVREDVWLVSLPLYHMGGLSLIARSLLHGGTLRFPQEDWQTDLVKHRVTHISLVPTQLRQLLSTPETCQALEKLKVVLVGGAPCPADLVKRAVDLQIPIHSTYGLTEMASQVTTTAPGEAAECPGGCGQVLSHRELCMARDGEILVKGRTLCKAIVFGDKTFDPLDGEDWLRTGDLGSLDTQGRLTVWGRKDAMFISGGENIQPEEIEQALLQLPEVEQCLVVPIPDDRYGQRPVAFLRPVSSKRMNRSELLEAVLVLERFKRPDHFFYWPAEAPNTFKPDRAWFATHALCSIRSNRTDQFI